MRSVLHCSQIINKIFFMVPVNYLAVVISAVAAMVLGFLWYGPVFGKMWAHEMGWTHEAMEAAKRKGMTLQYIVQALGALLMAFVLAHSLIFAASYLHVSGISAGLQAAVWSWLGFIVPVTLTSVLWDGKSWKLWGLNTGYYLVTLCVMGIILSLWA
jgi:hypothetical protein